MQAIITKYIGPSNSRGSRIKATIHNNFYNKIESLTIAFDSTMSDRDNHAAAAMKLVRQIMDLDSGNDWQCGELPNGQYCFVMEGEAFSRYFGAYTTPRTYLKD